MGRQKKKSSKNLESYKETQDICTEETERCLEYTWQEARDF